MNGNARGQLGPEDRLVAVKRECESTLYLSNHSRLTFVLHRRCWNGLGGSNCHSGTNNLVSKQSNAASLSPFFPKPFPYIPSIAPYTHQLPLSSLRHIHSHPCSCCPCVCSWGVGRGKPFNRKLSHLLCHNCRHPACHILRNPRP